MGSSAGRLAEGTYLLLTTYRRDGTPVATPVWLAPDGEDLVVITDADSGKAKRLRNDGRVALAPCDVRGRPAGPEVPGTAVLLDADGTARVLDLITRRYGLLGRFLMWRGRRSARVGIRIRPGDARS